MKKVIYLILLLIMSIPVFANNTNYKYYQFLSNDFFINEIEEKLLDWVDSYYKVFFKDEEYSKFELYKNGELTQKAIFDYEEDKTIIHYYDKNEQLEYYEIKVYSYNLLTELKRFNKDNNLLKREIYNYDNRLLTYSSIENYTPHNGSQEIDIKKYYYNDNKTFAYIYNYHRKESLKKYQEYEIYSYYNQGKINRIERYENNKLVEIDYYNSFGNIIRKEFYDFQERLSSYYIYVYEDIYKLISIEEYKKDKIEFIKIN